MEKLSQLRTVRLIGLDRITDLDMLLSVPHLEYIVLDRMVGVDNIETLFTIPTLKSLMIAICPRLASRGSIHIDLKLARKIEYIQIADSGLVDAPEVSSIPESLKFLNFSGNKLTSFLAFRNIPLGVRVYLFGNPIAGKPGASNIVMDIRKFLSEVPREYQETY